MKYLHDDALSQLTQELTDCPVGTSRHLHGRLEIYTMKRAGTDKKYASKLGETYVAWQEANDNAAAAQQQLVTLAKRKGRKRSVSTGDSPLRQRDTEEEEPHHKKTKTRARSSSLDALPVIKSTTATALGDFTVTSTRRLMTDLVLTLNLSFPDYDFGNAKPTDFSSYTVQEAVSAINTRLSEIAVQRDDGFLPGMWSAVDAVVHLSECDVYSYQPEQNDAASNDPMQFLQQSLSGDDDAAMDEEDVEDTPRKRAASTVLWSFNYFFVNKTHKRILLFTCVETMRVGYKVSATEEEEEDEETTMYRRRLSADSSSVWPLTPRPRKLTGDDDDDDDDEEGDLSGADFDLDPAATVSGGIPIQSA